MALNNNFRGYLLRIAALKQATANNNHVSDCSRANEEVSLRVAKCKRRISRKDANVLSQ